ncbi:lipopolysaccharide biosynthesis protein [Thermosipho sp. 1063]|uniref:WecB/TagA/CpsF family glycosyltransferase n=1 Tax=unclassified Thermosipho (in: thermotogales) TaxID=2676525 RepID=UPI0009494A88|nr:MULTISPECIES: WecB/TagA/CpsF family glycosyltransferase [unclassified Thermosipho (in: thermotogales)]ANQ54248.1 lipopolysaccharide biosynthesis protein [Thermosipho sp. 1070]APT72693.1 lipopolysaccharide biosynthesis protein [Thermosipho sp. 1063]OOC42085.1 lipopolysaccharide biosynthesis protein [Thermosipho sp. 1074]
MEVVNFSQLKLTIGKEEEVRKKIVRSINDGQKTFVVTLNASILLRTLKDSYYRKIVEKANYIIPDGSGIVWALKRNRNILTDRITGIDTMLYLCRKAKEYNWKVYLLGSRTKVVEEAAKRLREEGVNIVGYYHGYFSENDFTPLEEIEALKPELLFVGMGVPKQEEWIYNNFFLPFKLAMGVGGSFDVISGTKKRAPSFFQKMKLEWFYRWLQSPIKKRHIPIEIIKYTFLVLRGKIR